MPREVVALVSADDVVATVRVYADRVHDLLRRSGCGAEESIEVCESYAFALVDAVVNAPETVGDMAGWWFGRSLELGRRLGHPAGELATEVPASVLSGTSGEEQIRAALASLPESERAAVMLRDAYDLPTQAVGVALARDLAAAADTIAIGRLHLVARYDSRDVPSLAGHTGRSPADIGVLGQLADGTLPAPRTLPLRRHLSSCPPCENVVEMMAKGRRLAAGLPVIAMPDDARTAMIERVATRADAVLPTVDEVLTAIDEYDESRPAISPMAVVLAVVLALVLGVGVAAVTTLGPASGATDTSPAPTAGAPEPLITETTAPGKKRRTASPSATATRSAPASPTTTPTTARPVTTHSRSERPVADAAIALSPTSGPRGTTITVTGTGWEPNATVDLRYAGSLVSSTQTAFADSRGRFSAQLQANGTLPGRYTVTADDGTQTASATFQQTS